MNQRILGASFLPPTIRAGDLMTTKKVVPCAKTASLRANRARPTGPYCTTALGCRKAISASPWWAWPVATTPSHPQLGLAGSWPTRPCERHHRGLAATRGSSQHAHHLRRHGHGHRGHDYSLVGRESFPTASRPAVQGRWMDGVVVVGCDKNMPGGLMGMPRASAGHLRVCGTILPGN